MRHLLATTAALAVFLGGCASGNVAKARQVSLAVLKVNAAAVESFKKFDFGFQKHVVEKAIAAGTQEALDEAEQILSVYRQKRGQVLAAFEKVQNALALGNALIPLVESGVNKEADLVMWMAQLGDAMKELQVVLASFGVKMPFQLPL